MAITSRSAGVAAAVTRSENSNRLIAMRAEPADADPTTGSDAVDAPLLAEVAHAAVAALVDGAAAAPPAGRDQDELRGPPADRHIRRSPPSVRGSGSTRHAPRPAATSGAEPRLQSSVGSVMTRSKLPRC